MLAAGALLGAACSTLPSREWPPHDERHVVVTMPTNGDPLEIPVSGPMLTIFSLRIEPQPQRQRFQDGKRWIHPAADCETVQIRCHYRVYGPAGEQPPPPSALFPEAAEIRTVPGNLEESR